MQAFKNFYVFFTLQSTENQGQLGDSKQVRQPISLLRALFIILSFYLPMQYRYHGLLKRFVKMLGVSFLSHDLNHVLAFYLTDLVMIGMIVICIKKWREALFANRSLLLFLGISFLSVVFSKNGNWLWPYISWAQLVLPILLYLALSTQTETKKFLRLFCWILLIISLFESGVSIGQYLLQREVGLKNLGEPIIHCNGSPNFLMSERTRWIFDRLFHISAPSQAILRVTGTLPHPNVLGGFMGVALLATSWLFLEMRKGRFILGVAIILQTLVLFLTYSRAALFGWIGALLILLWLAKRFYSVIPLAIVTVSALLISGGILQEQLLHRGGIMNYNATAKGSDLQRVHYQKMAVEMAKKHPWIGVGWNQFLLHAQEVAPPDLPEGFQFLTVHSIYFLLLAETGILGLSSFLLFVGSLVLRVWRQGITQETALLIAIWSFLLAIGCCDHYLLTSQQGRLLFFISAALLFSQRAAKSQLHLTPPAHLRKAEADLPSC